MPLRLTEGEANRMDDLGAELYASSAISEAVEAYNSAVKSAAETLNAIIREANDTLSDCAGFTAEVAERLRSEFDDKSERWREGDKRQAADAFISHWEETADNFAAMDEIGPEDIEVEFLDLESLTMLPDGKA
jgi:Holliday junction resolvasome RuvABC DNA-binding subunit